MAHGFMYLVVIMDGHSRTYWRGGYQTPWMQISVWKHSKGAQKRQTGYFQYGPGSQFTGKAFTGLFGAHGIKISMDGKGSYRDNCLSRGYGEQ